MEFKYTPTLYCERCGYKYKPKGSTKPPRICPNCGAENTVRKQPDAETIIKESNIL